MMLIFSEHGVKFNHIKYQITTQNKNKLQNLVYHNSPRKHIGRNIFIKLNKADIVR